MLVAATIGAATGWRNAMCAAAAPLMEVSATTPECGECCVGLAEELGPYFVLSPEVVLAHARAGGTCPRPGLSLLRLGEPVGLSHEVNDSADLVFCLASPGNETHMAGLRAFAFAMSGDLAERLRGAAPDELASLPVEASAT